METMLFLRHQIIHDLSPIEGPHVIIEADSMRKQLAPVIIGLAVIIRKDRGIDPAAGQLDRIGERALGAVRDRYAFAVIRHAEVQIVPSVFLDAVRCEQKGGRIDRILVFKGLPILRMLLQHLLYERRGMVPVDTRILRCVRIIGPWYILPIKRGCLLDLPGLHVCGGYHMVFFAAIDIRLGIIASIHIQFAVWHHMCLAVRHMEGQRQDRVSLVLNDHTYALLMIINGMIRKPCHLFLYLNQSHARF